MPATPSAADLLAIAARRNAMLDLSARTLLPTYGARNAAAALQELTSTVTGRRAAEAARQELTATAAARRAAAGSAAADRQLHRPRAGMRESRHAHRAPSGLRP